MTKLWPKKLDLKCRIGVLKLVPKVHKITGPITSESWKTLSSRPIRGAENDPMRKPSQVLFALLKELLSIFKKKFPKLENNQESDFTVLAGCDDYIGSLSKLRLKSENMMKTTILTADFGDAYTETGINHIQESV